MITYVVKRASSGRLVEGKWPMPCDAAGAMGRVRPPDRVVRLLSPPTGPPRTPARAGWPPGCSSNSSWSSASASSPASPSSSQPRSTSPSAIAAGATAPPPAVAAGAAAAVAAEPAAEATTISAVDTRRCSASSSSLTRRRRLLAVSLSIMSRIRAGTPEVGRKQYWRGLVRSTMPIISSTCKQSYTRRRRAFFASVLGPAARARRRAGATA